MKTQKRNFYIKETINSKWSVRELQRQRDSLLYERLTISADKEKILELSEKGLIERTGATKKGEWIVKR